MKIIGDAIFGNRRRKELMLLIIYSEAFRSGTIIGHNPGETT
ncbi:MAG: hypothetical protein ACYCYE_18170 [Clostridia bacterium]